MNYRSKIIVTAILTALIVGGGVYEWQHSQVRSLSAEVNSLGSALDQTLADLRSSNLARTRDVQPLTQRVSDLETQVEKLLEDPANSRIPTSFLTVYAGTSDYPDLPLADYYIAVSEDLPVMKKLQTVAAKLSTQRFSELPIEVVGVKSVHGKRIATIGLRELYDDLRLPRWQTRYFQGSTGGGLTQTTLVYTFLQKKYRGEWVDGVRFMYEGKPFQEGDWDHIGLAGIYYR